MEPRKNQFQLNLPGLLKVLAEHLYSSKKVAIRELIQNGHDSTIRRHVEEKPASYNPRIDIWIDDSQQIITIRDNGAGLTDEGIERYLATIGNSYTRELGEDLSFLSPDEASRLIGQFGLGFLSAFLIASDVTLITRAHNSAQAYQWTCDGSEYYELTESDYDRVGTHIELVLKPEAQFLLQESVLTETVRQYADFIDVPIHINNSLLPVNLMLPPWDDINPEEASRKFVERAFHQKDPICIIPLSDHEVDLGHDSILIPMQGFVYVPSHSVVSIREYGDMRVYIRRMFITDSDRDLLPSWARFVRGVIDCPVLQPTASREDIHQEETHLAVQQALEQQLLQGLRDIAQNDQDTWKQIVEGHAEMVIRWAIMNNEFFDQIADMILVQTSRGRLNLPDYLEQSKGTLYFITREIGSLQEQLLGEGFEVPVIDASATVMRPFLEKYASWNPKVNLVQMDGESRQLLRPVEEDTYESLLQFYRKRRIIARVAAFKPEEVPAIVQYPRNAETLLDARRALDAGELSKPFAAMVEAYLNQHEMDDDDGDDDNRPAGILYLNALSPLVNQLAKTPPPQPVRDATLTLIYQIARLFSGRTMSVDDARRAFGEATESIQDLLSDDR